MAAGVIVDEGDDDDDDDADADADVDKNTLGSELLTLKLIK